ncbi:MAG TPA: hypothetical protein VF532_17725 [Candidatus Angelobacter sp.]
MKILFWLLVVSVATVLVSGVAVWLRLRWHLRRSGAAVKGTVDTSHPEHGPVE